jgi:hypothetical protein
LLDVFADYNVPIDLAVIPKSISRQTAASLRKRLEESPRAFPLTSTATRTSTMNKLDASVSLATVVRVKCSMPTSPQAKLY